MNSILIALISVIVTLIIVIFALITLKIKVDKIVEMLEEEEEEEEENSDIIECPHCKSTDRLFVAIHWSMNMPEVGQCPECMKTWQNSNTKEHPHLREVK